MMKFFYTLNTLLRPYKRIIYKVTNFISMLLIFILGVLFGLGIGSDYLHMDFYSYLERVIKWVK